MKISIDAGALCASASHRFGNYIFSENLIKALTLYDSKNDYFLYSFCQKSSNLKLKKNFIYKRLLPKIFWSKLRLSIEEIREKKDYFLALNQSIPLLTKSTIISFSHGLSFYFYPQFYPDSAEKMKKQHEIMIKRSSKIIVPSEKVKEELYSIFPSWLKLPRTSRKIVVLPYGIPFDMLNEKAQTREKFFLVVGMNHPIKNRKILPVNKYKFIFADGVGRAELKRLYSRATALVTTSLYESFNLPVIEALSMGCPVIGLKTAIIPELKEYVNVAKNQEDLIELMNKALNAGLKEIDQKRLLNQFNWRRYVEGLTAHYQ